MKIRTYAMYSLMPVIGAGVMGVGIASAHGFSGTPEDLVARFQKEAAVLGISVDEVKVAWAKGTDFGELAKAKGFTQAQIAEKMKASRIAEMKAYLQSLVAKGVITQAQADQRFAFMQTRQAKKLAKADDKDDEGRGWGMGGKKGRGFGRGGRFGGL